MNMMQLLLPSGGSTQNIKTETPLCPARPDTPHKSYSLNSMPYEPYILLALSTPQRLRNLQRRNGPAIIIRS